MSLMQEWREQIYHARIYKPQWRPYIQVLDTLKGLATLAMASAYVYGLWYILYGFPDQNNKPNVSTAKVMSSVSGSDSKPGAKTGEIAARLEQPLVLRAVGSAPGVLPSPSPGSGSTERPDSTAVEKSISRSKKMMRAKNVLQPTAAPDADNTVIVK